MTRRNDPRVSDLIGRYGKLRRIDRVGVELSEKALEAIGSEVLLTAGVDSDGDVEVQFANGERCYWPVDFVDIYEVAQTSPTVKLEVNVESLESVHEALTAIVGLSEFRGSPVKVAGFVQDMRSESSGAAVGSKTAIAMLQAARFVGDERPRRRSRPEMPPQLLALREMLESIGGEVVEVGSVNLSDMRDAIDKLRADGDCDCEGCEAARERLGVVRTTH